MAKKLLVHALISMILLFGGVSVLVVMHYAGSDIPTGLVRRIVHQLPAQQPDSYFVPTPLPVAQQSIFLQKAPPQADIQSSEAAPPDSGNSAAEQAPDQSGLAVLAATSTPVQLPASPSTSQSPPVSHDPSSTANSSDSGESSASANRGPTSTSQVAAPQQIASTGSNTTPQLQLLPTATLSNRAPSNVTSPAVASPAVAPLAVEPAPIAPSQALTGFSHEWQTWNNCGPATLAMNLSFFGSPLTQADVGSILRQHEDDKNVTPAELVAFAQAQGYHAQMRVNGSEALLKLLLSNQIPVLIETWMEPDPNDGMGHYRLLTGYDDEAQKWIAYDSYVSHDFVNDGENYEGILLPYAETDAMWRVFNRTYLLIYNDAKAGVVQSILGDALDPQIMWQESLIKAQDELTRDPKNPFIWFNLGSTLIAIGDYGEAAAAFDQARRLGLPWRMLWYQFGPFEAYYETGRYDEVMALAYATIANTESIEEIFYWKGQGLAATGNPESAQKAWQQALTLNPTYQQALDALAGFE